MTSPYLDQPLRTEIEALHERVQKLERELAEADYVVFHVADSISPFRSDINPLIVDACIGRHKARVAAAALAEKEEA